MQHSHKLKLHNCKQVVCVSMNQSPFKCKQFLDNIHILSNHSIIVDHHGNIEAVGPSSEIDHKYQNSSFQRIIDCQGLCALPGLVDAHTHALFMGDRSKEFQMKLENKTYTDIYNQGLGIRFTVDNVRKATDDELLKNLEKHLEQMLRYGTTTVQIKSGYGLDTQNQIKMLRVINLATQKFKQRLQIVATYCGAHAIPKGKTQAEMTEDILVNQLPAINKAISKKQINPEFIDVFCQKNFYEEESSTKIMQAGKNIGLIPAFHGDELTNLKAGNVASQVGAKSISHLQYADQKTVQIMANQEIAAILLPTTQNIQKLPLPPIQLMRERGVIMALGTDFCPNAFCLSMQMAMHYACVNYRMYPYQALSAATLNSAYALNRSDRLGSIEKHKQADIILVNAQNWLYIIYGFGSNCVSKVIKKGKVVIQ